MPRKIKSNQVRIPRALFETCGWRSITLAHGSVEFPDGRCCRFNIRLMALPGENGDIQLIAEDINKNHGGVQIQKLRRAL